jgi:dihydrofolate reductase
VWAARGWWGDNPPYHVPVFVLTHHAHPPIVMEGGTSFHFVTGGIHEALKQSMEAAKGQDVHIGGGAATIRQYLSAGLVDEMHLAVSPVLMGRGESLLEGLDLLQLGYRVSEHVATARATHYVLGKAP